MPRHPDKVRLLFGPYQAPPLKRGQRAWCLYRDAAVAVTTWSDAPLPWPRCIFAGSRGRGRGLLVDEELARAIQHESAAAVGYWWGVSRSTVQHWRAAFGVGRLDSAGSRRLIRGAVQAGLNSRRHAGRLWTAAEAALVGALPDGEVARLTGRTAESVRWKRRQLERAAVRPTRGLRG
jgi:hypothetical protein